MDLNQSDQRISNQQHTKRLFDNALKLTFIAALAIWCFIIVKPFLTLVIWAAIIAVAIYPLFKKIVTLFNGRCTLSAVVFTFVSLSLLLTPVIMLTGSSVNGIQNISHSIEQDSLQIPPPPAFVADWPIVGTQIFDAWSSASENLGDAVKTYAPQLKTQGEWLFKKVTGTGLGILQFIISLLIAGAFLAKTDHSYKFFLNFTNRLAPSSGEKYALLTIETIRSVAQGVIGVALIQAAFTIVGLLFVDVPAPGLWGFLVLIIAIMQLPPLIVLAPLIIYVFTIAEPTTAIVFMIWSLIIGISDSFLKPIFLGRGMKIPMLVILIGAIGGLLSSGIIGLFIGAVVLALGYTLFTAWLEEA